MVQRTLLIAAVLSCLVPFGAALADFRSDYETAYEAYQAADSPAQIKEVAARFAHLAEREDAGALRANAYYWSGECWYDLKQYSAALSYFERTLLYPQSYKEEAARFKVAMCYVRLGRRVEAKWELTRFLRDYPASNLASICRRQLDKLGATVK